MEDIKHLANLLDIGFTNIEKPLSTDREYYRVSKDIIIIKYNKLKSL